MSQKERYLAEYEKFKHIIIERGDYTSKEGIEYKILSVDDKKETAMIETKKSGFVRSRTLHWCRKNLSLVRNVT